MGIVIEPVIDVGQGTPPLMERRSRHHAVPADPALGGRRGRTVGLAGWAVAAVAIGALFVARSPARAPALPGGGVAEARGAPRAPGPPTTHSSELIMNEVLAPACHYLFDLAAHALGTDAETYARSALTASGTRGRSLNDVVHDDLVAAEEAISRTPAPVSGWATKEDLAIAVDLADAAPCSDHVVARRRPPRPIAGAP
jgi:hypothetical protein